MIVSASQLAAMVVTLLICTVVPIVASVIVARRTKGGAGSVVAGALTFIVTQMVIRLPLLQFVLPRFAWFAALSAQPAAFIFFLAVTAALFEETGRLLCFRLLLADRLAYRNGIAFGVGHGGAEALLLVGSTYINNLIFSFMINAGTFERSLAGRLDPAMIETIRAAITGTPPNVFLAAGAERILTMLFHVGLSVCVLEGVVRGRSVRFYAAAVLAHTGANFITSWLAYRRISIWVVELVLAVIALLAVLFVLTARPRFGSRQEARDEGRQALDEGY